METVLLFVDSIKSQLPVDSRYIGLVVKMVGITYVSEFAANLCRDSGYSAIAGQIEMFAKPSILVVECACVWGILDAVGSFYERVGKEELLSGVHVFGFDRNACDCAGGRL